MDSVNDIEFDNHPTTDEGLIIWEKTGDNSVPFNAVEFLRQLAAEGNKPNFDEFLAFMKGRAQGRRYCVVEVKPE